MSSDGTQVKTDWQEVCLAARWQVSVVSRVKAAKPIMADFIALTQVIVENR